MVLRMGVVYAKRRARRRPSRPTVRAERSSRSERSRSALVPSTSAPCLSARGLRSGRTDLASACFVRPKPRKYRHLAAPPAPVLASWRIPLSDLVLWLDQLRLSDLARVGGKNASL